MIILTEKDICFNWNIENDMPLVSVVCISYNFEKYIAEAMDSFLLQKTTFPFEIVVGDDCSTDNTLDILKEYKKKYPKIIRIIDRHQNLGAMKNLINTIENCKGEYLAFCEGDDFWIDQDKMQIQIDAMKQTNCELSFHSSFEFHGDKRGKTIGQYINKKIIPIEDIILGGGGVCPTASLVVKSIALRNISNFYGKVNIGDYQIQVLGSAHAGALYIDKTMAVYRKNVEGSHSMIQLTLEQLENRTKSYMIMFKILDDILNNKYRDLFSKQKSKTYYISALWCLRRSYMDHYIKYMEQSFNEYELNNFRYKIGYYLRFLPKSVLLKLAPNY